MAVSNVCGFLEMQQLTNENVGMHKIGSGGNMVYGITIDALHLPELDLLHLDLEGYEENAMVGAIDTLLRCRPTVVLEMPDDPQNIYRMLKEVRYVSVKKYGESSLNEIFIPEEILPLLKIPLDKEPPKKSTRRKKTAPKKTS